MFGSVTDLPRLHNFEDAVEFYKSVKGVRGREHVKPLKSTRRTPDSYRISADKNPDGTIRAVYCWLYRTPVLVYFPNYLVVNSYASNTTNNFIGAIAPHWLRAGQKANKQRFYVRGEGEFLAGEDGKIVVAVNPETYQPLQGEVKAAKLEKIVLNRTRAAEARKGCKDVVELARVTSKVDGYWKALVETKDIAPDEETAWLKGILKLCGYRYWETYRGALNHSIGYAWAVDSTDKLLPHLKKFIYQREYDRLDCYDYEPSEYGVVPNDWRITQ